MKQNKPQWRHSILVIGLFLFLINSCSKDDGPSESGTFTDPEGNVYHTVKICDQVWMVENLKVTKFRNGDAIPKTTDKAAWGALNTGAYCYYNNDSMTYAATYDKLYNWHAVNDSRGLAPEGWHIPTDFEWTALGACLGGDSIAGGPMKEIGTTWGSPNTGATNLSGFTGLPGGYRSGAGTFFNIGYYGGWWSSTEISMFEAWNREMSYNDDGLISYSSNFVNIGFSVRCLRD